ncbi:MAG: hypothetical protein M3N00_05920, partial [Actinomycetota bacterium]|nr:hypothetical protein [Actinomycetota bacterium]
GFGPRRGPWGHHGGSGYFLGLDAEKMGPRAQVAVALSVLAPAALGTVLVLSLFPQLFWLIFVFGWTIFPAIGLLARGLAGLSDARPEQISAAARERELLRALRKHGEFTPVRAATETSLSVTEADRMLKELAAAGHLEVRARNGGLFYALWGKKGAT